MGAEPLGGSWLLAQTADRLRAEGHPVVTALRGATLDVEYGTSWMDGHDGYIYDVMLTLTVRADAEDEVTQAAGDIRRVLNAIVGVFPDKTGELRKGSLTKLTVAVAERD